MIPSAKELAYADFRRTVGGLPSERLPLSASVEVTRRCPLTCAHCYNNLPVGDRAARAAELTTAEHRHLLDQMAAAGTFWLLFTGGEIFARPDFLEIYTHAKTKGFLITLFTNGTLITEEIADYLAEWPPFAIEITLYGRTRETYERLTGVSGSYDRCMRGIRLLLARGLPLEVKAVAVSINKHEIWDMQRFVEDEVGGKFRFDGMISPRIDCSQSPLGVRLSAEEVVELDMQDPRRTEDWRQMIARQQDQSPAEDQLYHCGGGVRSFAVDPYGKMTLCVLSQQEGYDLRAGTLAEGWGQFLGKVRSRKITRVTKCVRCRMKSMCGMCPATAELHGQGDQEQPVDFMCETAHLRAHALELEVPEHGACEFCAGGDRHAEMVQAAARLRALPADRGPPRRSLSVLREQPARQGCGSGDCSCS